MTILVRHEQEWRPGNMYDKGNGLYVTGVYKRTDRRRDGSLESNL